MAVSLKHKFTSAKADPSDATLIKPSNWNDEHDLSASANAVLIGTGTGTTELATGTAGRGVLGSETTADINTALGGALVPAGGTSGQVLKKNSATDYDATWQADATGGGGLTDGDYGDIVVSGGATAINIDSNVLSSFGRSLTDDADAATARTTLGLGSLATQSGTFSGTSSGTNTGDQTIALTGDVTGSGTGSFAATIAANAVTNAKAAQMAANTIKGNNTGGTANAADLTASQATAMLDVFVGDSGSGGTKGLVNAPATGDSTKFLKGDGTWASIPGGGDALTSNPLSQFATTTSAQLLGIMSDETGTGSLVFATSPGFTTAANPATSDGAALGTTALMWSDLFLASGGVVNWNNGDVTVTHTANTLTFAGASSGYVFDALMDISDSAAGQIKFPATQNASANANTLDDYEEGTFTPSITFGGGSTGITYTTQNGIYTKIGRTVFYNIVVTLSAKGSSTGAMVITGLPFTAAETYNYAAYVGYAASFTGLTGALVGFTAPSTTQVAIYQSAAATYAAVTNAAATNTTQIRVSGFYQV